MQTVRGGLSRNMVLVYIAQKRANRNGFPPKGMCVFVCVGVDVCALAHAHVHTGLKERERTSICA